MKLRQRSPLLWTVATVFCALAFARGATAVGKYSRVVSYEDEIVVRCPDPTKESVRILEKYSDVWRREKGSIDLRVKAHAFLSLRRYFPECSVVISDLEDHVQRAEAMMFPAKKAEEEAWIQDVLNEVLPSKQNLAECEEAVARLEAQEQSWFEEYHNYEAIKKWYAKLASDHSTLVRHVPSIGQSGEGRDMPAVHITASSNPERKKIYFQCQIHAREWISGATCMYISNYFVQNYGSNADVTSLLDNLEFIVLPFANPDGYAYTWSNDRLWRKNRAATSNAACRGVDLNRNFPLGWELGNDPNKDCAQDYGGPREMSEPETRNIISYYRKNAPIVGMIDWHSFGDDILHPWGWTKSAAPSIQYIQSLGHKMAAAIEEVHGTSYTPESSHELYMAYGLAADWFYSDDAAETNRGYRTVSYVVELRNKRSFLLPPEEIIPTGEEIIPAVTQFAKSVMEKPLSYNGQRDPIQMKYKYQYQNKYQDSRSFDT